MLLMSCRLLPVFRAVIREIKFDVTWPYVKRQTAKMTSEFVFFSSNPSLNHIKIEKCLLLITTNTNIFTLLFNELNTDGKSFIFAVCRLTYDHVTSNLISLLSSNSPVALIFTPIANLLLYGWIVLTTGQFTCNIKGPSDILSHNRCYRLQLLLTALV